jgi:ABC-type transport system involved in cytochrome c biogenesis ATPase subunit
MARTRRNQTGASPATAPRSSGESNETQEPFGRLTRVRIGGLLGEFSHDIELEREEPTILTGANGTGKSTILRVINAVGSGDWVALSRLPFKTASLYFAEVPKLGITRKDRALRVTQRGESWTVDLGDVELAEAPPRSVARMSPAERSRYIAQRNWLLHRSDIDAPVEARTRRRREQEAFEMAQLELLGESVPEWVQKIPDLFHVRFITDQRLVVRSAERDARIRRELGREIEAQEPIRRAVTHYSQDLGRRITMELRRYAAASQREDRTFPERVAKELLRQRSVGLEELLPLIDEVAARRDALERVGLAETLPEPRFDERSLQDPAVQIVFKTFGEATLRKFDVLESFRSSLELFASFLNRRFLGKTAKTRPEEGLVFELPDGSELRPAQLSSGEQQMLVLAYEVLFETPPGTLLLIDEPEISLHVLWQSTFVDDIAEMGRPRDLSFLLATHSPTLIGGRRELMRSLDQG